MYDNLLDETTNVCDRESRSYAVFPEGAKKVVLSLKTHQSKIHIQARTSLVEN